MSAPTSSKIFRRSGDEWVQVLFRAYSGVKTLYPGRLGFTDSRLFPGETVFFKGEPALYPDNDVIKGYIGTHPHSTSYPGNIGSSTPIENVYVRRGTSWTRTS